MISSQEAPEKDVLAIIGAGEMARSYADKAHEMGIITHCFAWDQGAIAKHHVDFFHPISIFETDTILEICKKEKVAGIVSTTELTIPICAFLQEQLKASITVSYPESKLITNKGWVREQSKTAKYLHHPQYLRVFNKFTPYEWSIFPAIVKPASEGGKRGVIVVHNKIELENAVLYSLSFDKHNNGVLIEEFLTGGREYSVESLSYNGNHNVIQITEKVSSGPPHCVELGHHQPAVLQDSITYIVRKAIEELLDAVSFKNGPTHTEIIIINNEVYLVELNARPGGDFIANTLVQLSTGYDYLGEAIAVSLGREPSSPPKKNLSSVGVFFVTKQTEYLKPIFDTCDDKDWLYKKHEESAVLSELENNDCLHQNYVIYCFDNSNGYPDFFLKYFVQ